MFSRKKMQTTNFPSSCVWSGDGTYTAQRLHNKNYSHGRRQAEKNEGRRQAEKNEHIKMFSIREYISTIFKSNKY